MFVNWNIFEESSHNINTYLFYVEVRLGSLLLFYDIFCRILHHVFAQSNQLAPMLRGSVWFHFSCVCQLRVTFSSSHKTFSQIWRFLFQISPNKSTFRHSNNCCATLLDNIFLCTNCSKQMLTWKEVYRGKSCWAELVARMLPSNLFICALLSLTTFVGREKYRKKCCKGKQRCRD